MSRDFDSSALSIVDDAVFIEHNMRIDSAEPATRPIKASVVPE